MKKMLRDRNPELTRTKRSKKERLKTTKSIMKNFNQLQKIFTRKLKNQRIRKMHLNLNVILLVQRNTIQYHLIMQAVK